MFIDVVTKEPRLRNGRLEKVIERSVGDVLARGIDVQGEIIMHNMVGSFWRYFQLWQMIPRHSVARSRCAGTAMRYALALVYGRIRV